MERRITVKHFESQSVWVSAWTKCEDGYQFDISEDIPENSTVLLKSEKNEYDLQNDILIPAKIFKESVRIIEYR